MKLNKVIFFELEDSSNEDYFTTDAKKVLALKTEIDASDKAIDEMVYELYGLTEE